MDLSLDYGELVRSLDRPIDPVQLGRALMSSAASRYEGVLRESPLHEFEQSGATFLFDLDFRIAVAAEPRARPDLRDAESNHHSEGSVRRKAGRRQTGALGRPGVSKICLHHRSPPANE